MMIYCQLSTFCQIIHRCHFQNYFYKSKCMSILALQLLQAFNLSEIAKQTYLLQKEQKEKKREAAERLTVSYVLSDRGFTLAELFGYHLSNFLKEDFTQIAKKNKLIRMNYQQFSALMNELWIDMKQYKLFLPILFAVLKGYNNTISPKDIQKYLNICKKDLNPFIVQIKQQISPQKMKQLAENIEIVCQREDLKGQGFVQKIIIADVIKKYLGETKEGIQIEEQLIVHDEINYKMLLGDSYFGCGKKIRQFLFGKIADKIKKCVKKVGSQKKKASKKKKQTKKFQKSPSKKKETKDQKLIREYMQQNKKQIKEDRKKLQSMVKSILHECIQNASQISEIQSDKKPEYKIKKSIYTAEPVIIQHQLNCFSGQLIKVFPTQHDSGVFITQQQGKIINLLDGSIRSTFSLNPSQALKNSTICDYAYQNNILYAIREDGLLFSWDNQSYSYSHMVQTQFRYKSKSIQEFNLKNVIFVAQGLIMINCQEINYSFELYSLDLKFIGNIFFNKQQFGISHKILKECREMSQILKSIKRDYIVKSQSQYQSFIRSSYQYKQYTLGQYIFNKFSEISAYKIGDLVDWIISYRAKNPLFLDKSMMQRLRNKKTSKQDFNYLQIYHYIQQATNDAVQRFMKKHVIIEVDQSQRIQNLINLLEDNAFKELEDKEYLTRKQLLECIYKCSLNPQQQKQLFSNLQYNSQGNICMHQLIHGQQYLRIISYRHNRFFSEDFYEQNELPPIIINKIMPFPLLDFFIVTTKFPNYNQLYVLSFHNVIINKINLNKYVQNAKVCHSPFLSYCQQSGYLAVCYNNAIIIWNVNQLSQKNSSPIKIIKALEKDRIIGLNFLYYSNTLATVTQQNVKFWDLQQILFSNRSSEIVFKIKPGFKAIEKKSETSKWQPKKKILIRGRSENFFCAVTKSNNYVVGVVSRGERATDSYLKMCYLCKFNIMIGSSRQFDLVPTKILRQLQSQARHMKYTQRILESIDYTQTQTKMIDKMISDYQTRMGQKKNINSKQLSIALINKITNLHSMLTQYSRFVNPNLMKTDLNIDDIKVFKFNLILKIYLCQTYQDIKKIFTSQFIKLYEEKGKLDKVMIIDDIFEWQDKTYLTKFLCIFSQIYKYSLPFKCSYIQLIYNQKQEKLDEKLIQMLLTNTQISKNIIQNIISLANQIKIYNIKTVIMKVVDKFLPTQYRFPSLRYYKNIYKHKIQAPFDYFVNRFDNYNRINIDQVIFSPKKYKDILEHLQNQKLIDKVQELSKAYPQIIRDNLQLIDICMSFTLITQQQATFYYLSPTNNTLVSLLSDNAPKKVMHDFDSMIGSILNSITQQKAKIPSPHFTYQWFYDRFKNIIGNDDKLYSIFYNQLRGSLTEHIAYSGQLQFYIDLNKKNIAINYNPLNWKQLLGTRVYSLVLYHSNIKQSLNQQKIVDCQSFQKCLQSFIPKQAQSITIRSCAASKNNYSDIQNFNQEKMLKIYKEDYINLNHFLYYLDQSKKDREASALSSSILMKKSLTFDIKIPSVNLINQLSKLSAFLTKNQVIQIISECVNTFTYGSMLDWVNSLPFVRMKGKSGKQTRVCAIWELKNHLKLDWETLGWILLNKYGKNNILNKCIIVDGTIDAKQVIQIFNSQAIFKLFIACNNQLRDLNTFPLELLQKIVEKNIVNPALQNINLVFKTQIINHLLHISEILLNIANKNEETDVQKFVKYFLSDSDTKQTTIKLIITNIVGKVKKIKIKQSLIKLATFVKGLPNCLQRLNNWAQTHKNQQKSLLERVLPIIEPHQIIKRNENTALSLIITKQHISQMLQQDQKWTYVYQPCFTLPQFFDYIHSLDSNENIQNLINNCVLKHGIHSIFNSIQQGSFAQFYAKCRSVSKYLSKLTVVQFSKIYQRLSDGQKGLSLNKLFKATQFEIMAQQRITWIIQYLQKSDKQHLNLQSLRISNLIMNINQPTRQLKSLTDSFKYEEYLIKRYIKSANKLAFILKQLEDNLITYQFLTQLKLSYQQSGILIKYLNLHGEEILYKMRQSENKATIQISQSQQKLLLEEIANYMKYFDQKIKQEQNNADFNVNFQIIQKEIKQTSLYIKKNQQNNPQWSCLISYINLYHYCKHLCVNDIFRKHSYRQMILDQFNRGLLSINLTLKNLYDIFGLAYLDNFIKYFQYLISPNPSHHAMETRLFRFFKKQLIQAFVRFDGVNEIKYPLNLATFKQILGQAQIKTLDKAIDYGIIYKKLNIWGCGYVNLNDLPQYRIKRLSCPYIDINNFISQTFPKVKKWRKINPTQPVFQNRQKICNQLIKLQEQSQSKCKMIRQDNLWRILGFYLTKQHRLFIEHQYQLKNNKNYYNIVDIVDWISTNDEQNETENAEILMKLAKKIQIQGGIYNIMRKYHKQIILSQSVDTHKQQNAYLSLLIDQSNTSQSGFLTQFIRQLINNNKIQQYLDEEHTIQNSTWLEQVLKLIVDTYNKQIRQWANYNNSLVKFLNELPQNQFLLIKTLYQANHTYSCHKLFDILANGAQYFTFASFWIYNINSDQAYPFCKEQVNQVYKIIDVNSDGNISYQQFCRFWSAVQQIYTQPQPPIQNQMTKIKEDITDTFLDSIQQYFEKQVDKDIEKMSIQNLQLLTNIKHKQKVKRLIKILNPQDKFGIFIDVHKLKVLLKQHKINKIKSMHSKLKHTNYFAKILGPQIEDYCKNKQNLQNTLNRWVYFTYPHFGCYLAQVFHELAWNKQRISKWINQHKQITQQPKTLTLSLRKNKINPKISPSNQVFYNQFCQVSQKFQLFCKKFLRKKFETRQYGKSISYRLYLNKTLDQFQILMSQIQQISYFLENDEDQQNKLIYNFQENQGQGQQFNVDNISILSSIVNNIKENKISFENPLLTLTKYTKENIEEEICVKQTFLRTKIQMVDKQLRGKSNNRLSLLSNKSLYDDPKISVSFYDIQISTMNKMTVYTDNAAFKPLLQVQILKNGKFTSIQSMIKLVEMASYISKHYNIIALFVNLGNLCIDYNGQKQFRLSQFYGGIKLDVDGNYFQGVNPKDINNDNNCVYPPEVYQNIYTETFDSYCLAHILYYLFTGQLIQSKNFAPSPEQSQWFNYSELHYKVKKHISFLSSQERSIDIESQIVFFSLLRDCTQFQWHMRPKVYQIAQTLKNIAQMNSNNLQNIGKELIIKAPISHVCIKAAKTGDVHSFTQNIKKSLGYQWQITQIQQIRQHIPDNAKFYYAYNELLQQILQKLEQNGDIDLFGAYMSNLVQYLCQSQKKQTAFLALQSFKDIIASLTIKRYFDYCDQRWRINEFNIQQKLKQLNMKNRINKLPKSSQYYFDLSTLIDTKITLFMGDNNENNKNKKNDSTKKIAMSFIQSSLLSHNVNKLCALQKSGVLLNLYKYLDDPQFEETVLKIYCLATSCLNKDEIIPTHRAIQEGYKVMMVMHNIINLQKGVKKGETVVDMLTFMNNYYNFYGQQCKLDVLRNLCQTQICNLPTFTYLFNTKVQDTDLLFKILLNLTYQQSYYKLLKGVTVHAYETCLKQIKKYPKNHYTKENLERILKNYESKVTLHQLSVQRQAIQNKQCYTSKQNVSVLFLNYQKLIEKHILFYYKKNSKLTKGEHYRYQNNFYEHYGRFLGQMRKISQNQLQNSFFNIDSCNIIRAILELHYHLRQIWYMQEETIKYMIDLTQKIYEKEFLYSENVLLNSIQTIILEIIVELAKKSFKILIKLGFIHFFMRIMKKQHEFLDRYIKKGVQNIQLKNIYSQQAEFRLNMIDLLLQSNSQEVHRIFVIAGFPKYLIENMLASHLLLDLRYYKANFDIVPFRYCSPLRSQAITALSFILPIKQSILRSEVISRLIPVLSIEKQRLQIPTDTPQSKMRFVQTLWLFGNIIQCEDERLKYEFVNNGTYEIINKLLQRCDLLNLFFPKMSETIRTGSILKSSMVFTRILAT